MSVSCLVCHEPANMVGSFMILSEHLFLNYCCLRSGFRNMSPSPSTLTSINYSTTSGKPNSKVEKLFRFFDVGKVSITIIIFFYAEESLQHFLLLSNPSEIPHILSNACSLVPHLLLFFMLLINKSFDFFFLI